MVRALRLHQWVKNALVFVPAVAGRRVGHPAVLEAALAAFFAFGLVASATYVVNDVLDRDADRRHATKRRRPYASGALPPWTAALLAPLLLAGGAAVAAPLPRAFGGALGLYFALTLAYSLRLKRAPVLDVLCLGALYTLRIFAGGAATGIPVSEWLATFSGFLFVSLAFAKRAAELARAEGALPGRGYGAADRGVVFGMGIASGYLSVMVLALYVTSEEVRRMYSTPRALWALCPLVLYWVSRLWLRAARGAVEEDPIVDAARDAPTYAIVAAMAGVLWIAS